MHEQIKSCLPSQFHSSEMDQFTLTLAPANGSNFPQHTNLQRGDNVILSSDVDVALATGYLAEINPEYILITTDRNLHHRKCDFQVQHHYVNKKIEINCYFILFSN